MRTIGERRLPKVVSPDRDRTSERNRMTDPMVTSEVLPNERQCPSQGEAKVGTGLSLMGDHAHREISLGFAAILAHSDYCSKYMIFMAIISAISKAGISRPRSTPFICNMIPSLSSRPRYSFNSKPTASPNLWGMSFFIYVCPCLAFRSAS